MYIYTNYGTQPLKIRFEFRPTQFHRSSIGTVQVTICVAECEYGPYDTGIRTTTVVWDGRQGIHPRKTSQEIDQQVQSLREQLEVAWHSLLSLNQSITGNMILEKAGLTYPEIEKLDLFKLSYLGSCKPKGFINVVFRRQA